MDHKVLAIKDLGRFLFFGLESFWTMLIEEASMPTELGSDTDKFLKKIKTKKRIWVQKGYYKWK